MHTDWNILFQETRSPYEILSTLIHNETVVSKPCFIVWEITHDFICERVPLKFRDASKQNVSAGLRSPLNRWDRDKFSNVYFHFYYFFIYMYWRLLAAYVKIKRSWKNAYPIGKGAPVFPNVWKLIKLKSNNFFKLN